MILEELRSKFHSCSLHNFAKFVEIEPSTTMFYSILSVFLKVMKLGSLERLEVSGVISVQLFTMYWNKCFFGFKGLENIYWFPWFLFLCVSFMFIVYVGNFNLWWPKMASCKAIYSTNTTEKTPDHVIPKVLCFQFPNPNIEKKQAEIWLNDISVGYNISTYTMVLSVSRNSEAWSIPNYIEASIVNINIKTADWIRSCKQLQISEQHELWFIYHTKHLHFAYLFTKNSLSTFFSLVYL